MFFVVSPDLIPVSSTVIPLEEYQQITAGNTTSIPMSEEYKIAYIKHIHKKAHAAEDDPDTSITCK